MNHPEVSSCKGCSLRGSCAAGESVAEGLRGAALAGRAALCFLVPAASAIAAAVIAGEANAGLAAAVAALLAAAGVASLLGRFRRRKREGSS